MTRSTCPMATAALLAASVTLAVGCTGGGGGGSGASGSAGGVGAGVGGAAGTTGPQPPPLVWLKGDLHVHSNHSPEIHGVGDTLPAVFRLADGNDLDFITLTDHRTHSGSLDPDFANDPSPVIRIPGEEWGENEDSHLGMQGVFTDIPDVVDRSTPPSTWNAQVQAIIDGVRAQGGLVVVNHPTNHRIPWIWDVTRIDAVEVWNTFWALYAVVDIDESAIWDRVGPTLQAAGHQPDPDLLAVARLKGIGQRRQALLYYEALLARGERIACVGGGDRHLALMPGHPTTHVGVERADAQGVLDGIRACRTYVTAHPSGPSVDFAADQDGDGVFETALGGEVPVGQPATFRVAIRNTPGGRVELRRSGVTVAVREALTDPVELVFTDTPSAGDWYRVDFYEPVDTSIPGGIGLLMVALSPALQDPHITSLSTYTTILAGFAAIPAIQTTMRFVTALPVIPIPADYSRILHADLRDPSWSMAAITSPIFAR